MSGATPGQWLAHTRLEGNLSGGTGRERTVIEIEDGARPGKICGPRHGHRIASIHPQPETAANAALIETAPELLAALRKLIARIDGASGQPTYTSEEYDALEALVARAAPE